MKFRYITLFIIISVLGTLFIGCSSTKTKSTITINPTTMTLRVGEEKALLTTVDGDNKKVLYSTNDDKIAYVNSEGKVKGIAKGIATITAISFDGSNISCSVEVTIPEFTKEEVVAAKGIIALKNHLKNPSSLQVHKIGYWYEVDGLKDLHVDIDISAQNGFGGMNRETYVIMLSTKWEKTGFTDKTLGVTLYTSDMVLFTHEISIENVNDIIENEYYKK